MAGALVNWIKRRKITVVLLVVTFVVSGLLVNLVQLLTLPLYWINKRLYRVLNAKIVYFHWCILPWTLENWAEYDIKVYGDPAILPYVNTEHVLVVLNHRGDLDWMIGWAIIDRMGMLGGVKAIMKDVAKYLPGIGWSFLFMEYPLLKRVWAKDEARLKAACKNLEDYPVNMLLCLFAEGTRYTEEKHRLSMEYSRKNGLPVLKHHLFPRTKGFCFLMKNLEKAIGSVYDITICYRGQKEPSMVGVVNAESCSADLCVRRFPISEIPMGSDKEMTDWLINLFKEKDDLIEYHNQHERFPGPITNLELRPWAGFVVLGWICTCSIPLLLLLLYLMWNGMWIVVCTLLAIIILADQLFQRIARETVVAETSSSYGLRKENGTSSSTHQHISKSDSPLNPNKKAD